MFHNTRVLLSLLGLLGSDVVMSTSTCQTTSWAARYLGILFIVNGTEGAITDGLLRLYRGDGDATDSTGNGPTLTGEAQYTDVTFPESGRSRKVFDFSNTLNGLDGSCVGLPAGASDRSMVGWMKFHDLGGRTDGDPYGYGVHMVISKQFNVDVYGKWTITLDYVGIDEGVNPIVAAAVADTWYHLVLTYTNSDNTNRVYLNGVLVKTGVPSSAPQTDVDDAISRLWIGEHAHSPSTINAATYKGQVADVAIFNRVLSLADAGAIFADDDWYSVAGGGGDPHFFGFGGKFFTWQGHCDVVLIKTPNLNNKDENLEVHIRTKRVRKWSKIKALAIKVGQDKGEIESDEGKFILNGSQVDYVNTDLMTVVKSVSKSIVLYEFTFSHGEVLEVRVNTRTKMVHTSLSGSYPEGTVGILGSPRNPGLFARDGENMEGKNVNKYIESWQVNYEDPHLFHEGPFPQYPSKCIYKVQRGKSHLHPDSRRLKSVHKLSKEEATAACATHPLGPLKQFCIEDVLLSEDLNFAQDEFYG